MRLQESEHDVARSLAGVIQTEDMSLLVKQRGEQIDADGRGREAEFAVFLGCGIYKPSSAGGVVVDGNYVVIGCPRMFPPKSAIW